MDKIWSGRCVISIQQYLPSYIKQKIKKYVAELVQMTPTHHFVNHPLQIHFRQFLALIVENHLLKFLGYQAETMFEDITVRYSLHHFD